MLPRYKCKRCGHSWIPRLDVFPSMCPRCKSRLWDREKKDDNKNCETEV